MYFTISIECRYSITLHNSTSCTFHSSPTKYCIVRCCTCSHIELKSTSGIYLTSCSISCAVCSIVIVAYPFYSSEICMVYRLLICNHHTVFELSCLKISSYTIRTRRSVIKPISFPSRK